MKPWIKWSLLGVVAYLGFLLVQFPAPVAISLIDMAFKDQRVTPKFYGVDGSLWQGEAKRVELAGQRFSNVKWRVHPSSFLWGNASITVAFKEGDNRGKARISQSVFGTTHLSDIDATYSAQDLLDIFKIPALKAGGQFELKLEELEIENNMISSAQGVLLWRQASTAFPQQLTLGDLKADVTTGDQGIKAKLNDGGGALEVSGEVLLTPDGKYQFKGVFGAREGQNSTLGRSLRMLGRPDSKGKIQVNQKGKLSDFGFLTK